MNQNPELATFFIKKNHSVHKILWLHGWGQSHQALWPMAEFFEYTAESMLIDFPGFGQSSPPPQDWGTEEYMEQLYQTLLKNNFQPAYIVGHSFGCRIAIRLAAKYPQAVQGLILIAAAGLKKRRSLAFKLKAGILKFIIKSAKMIDHFFETNFKTRLASRFGSSDYQKAGVLRNTFVKVVNEDLAPLASQITAETLLIYGEKDEQTPVELGQRLQKLIPNSKLLIIPYQDHYRLLTSAKSQVIKAIKDFIGI